MEKVAVIFKSGAIVNFTAKEFKIGRDENGKTTGIAWDCKGINKYPVHITLENIDAILVEKVGESIETGN
ncbi:hypothetical protein MHH74_05985 [Bacillus sp. FSL M7-0996]|uniref:hypothetical protein n=1 Tax=Bacillus sp. FSL M7-0996 TaxID=2921538 RepID=UPI0030FAA1A0